MTRSLLLLYALPPVIGAMPLVNSIAQALLFAMAVATAALMAAHYWKTSRMLERVEDLLTIAKGHQQLATRQQAEAARLMTQVPATVERTVRETIASTESGEHRAVTFPELKAPAGLGAGTPSAPPDRQS